MRHLSCLLLFCAPLVAACSGSGGPTGELTIANKRLTLEGVGNACYGLTVKNGLGQVVWQKSGLCADRYGNQTSDITYIGTCDASAGAQTNTVELIIEGLFEDDGDPIDFVNPAPAGSPIVQTATCIENEDTRVDFNVVVARPAGQGFVDAAVNFEDVFCSAKLDCSANNIVQDPISGQRIDSAVVAFACTGGVGADTHMYWSDLEITCGTTTTVVPLDGEPGKIWSATNPAPAPLRQAILYRGLEELTQGLESLGKSYFSVALGVDFASVAGPCTINMRATASDGALDACTTPADAIYPVMNIGRAFIANNAFACAQHAIDQVPGADIWTSYTLAGPVSFTNEASAQGDDFVVQSCAPPSITLTASDASFDELGDVARVNVRLSRAPSSPVTVPVSVSAGNAMASVVLDTNNWNSGVEVVISGADDRTQQGNIAVTFTAGASTSSDLRFAALSATTALVFVQNGTYCGDGVMQAGEACDGASNPATCASLGHDGGSIDCTAGCVIDAGACTDCGDGSVDPGELCDGNSVACDTLGDFTDGAAPCTASCTFDTSACTTCGNDDQEGSEDCDGDDLAAQSCVTLGYVGGTLACDACIFDEADCETSICGNLAIESGEQCDPPNTPSSCAYGQTCATCSAQCQSGSIQGPFCGDGVANGPEACDGGDVPTCAELDAGNPFGTVTCTGACEVTANCSNDACAGQPTVITSATLNGYAAPAGIAAPQCVTRITGTLTITGPFTGGPVIHFPNLVRIGNDADTTGDLALSGWPSGVALLPQLTYARAVSAVMLTNSNVVLPNLRRKGPGGVFTPIFAGSNTVWDLPAIEGATAVGVAAGTTFNFGASFTYADIAGSGTFNMPASLTTIARLQAQVLVVNAPNVTSIGVLGSVSTSLTGVDGVTTAGTGGGDITLIGANFPNLVSITGGGTVRYWSANNMPNLQTVAAVFRPFGVVSAPASLTTVNGLSLIDYNPQTFAAAGLTTINGPLLVDGSTVLLTLSLPALTTITGSFTITDNTALPVAVANALRAQITTGPTVTTICGNQGDVACP